MPRREGDSSFGNSRWRNDGGGRRSMPPGQQQRTPSPEGFGGGFGSASRYMKKSEKYNPVNLYEPAVKGKSSTATEKRQKTKFVSLYGEGGKERAVIKLPGRHECNCQATIHALVNNCLSCGRIVCEQEGSGGCFFCLSLVCSREEQKILDQGGRKAEDLRKKLLLLSSAKPVSQKHEEENGEEISEENTKSRSGKAASAAAAAGQSSSQSSGKEVDKGLEKALAEKDRLLEFQRSSARRTMVYDDESDYFNVNSNAWLSSEERTKLRNREEELRSLQNQPRSQRKITLDLANRKVIAENTAVDLCDVNDAVVQEVYFGKAGAEPRMELFDSSQPEDDIHRPGLFRPMYDDNEAVGKSASTAPSTAGSSTLSGRLQDSTLQDLRDQGRCLSMHQPYASLLVMGIKKHEGRSWYTSHRGPLWIASTAKQAQQDDIQMVELFYRNFYGDSLPDQFPNHYPSGCLLGCVDMVDCLAQEQYRQLYPSGESESPYVWICENPRQLTTVFPIRGQHKIYLLDPTIHQAARKMITVAPGK